MLPFLDEMTRRVPASGIVAGLGTRERQPRSIGRRGRLAAARRASLVRPRRAHRSRRAVSGGGDRAREADPEAAGGAPYGINVQIERFADEDGRIIINAVIWVERAGQKAIVIGQGGERLKEIGVWRASSSTICGSARCIWSSGSRSRKTGRTTRWLCASSGTRRCESARVRPPRAGSPRATSCISTPYRDTSRIVEVFTAEHGRLTLFARGANSAKSTLRGVLRPFQRLLVSWSGSSEACQLVSAEIDGALTTLAKSG